MNFLTFIKDRYLVSIVLLIISVLAIATYIEYSASRDDLYQQLNNEAVSLIEVLQHSSENILLASEELEMRLLDELINNARTIALLDSQGILTPSHLQHFITQYNLHRIRIINSDGSIAHDSHPKSDETISLQNYRTLFKPLISGEKELLYFESTKKYQSHFLYPSLALRRQLPRRGVLFIEAQEYKYIEMRQIFGIGKLLRDIGKTSGIVYVAIQDSAGIVAASGSVYELSAIESDPLLSLTLQKDTTIARELLYDAVPAYEVARTFTINSIPVGVIRIGLSLEHLQHLQNRVFARSILLSASLLFFIIIVVVAQKRLYLSQQKATALQTYTDTLLDEMHDAVITINDNKIITIFNKQAEKLFRVSATDVLNKPYTQSLADFASILDTMFFTMSDSDDIVVSFGDQQRYFSVARTTTNNLRTIVLRDRTELKQLESELRQKEKLTAIGHLASGIAHEIRNPLNAISLLIQRLQQEFTPRKNVKTYHELLLVLKNEIHRLNTIVEQFLRFARPMKLQPTAVPIHPFVHHIVQLFEPQAQDKNIHFTYECQFDDSCYFDADKMTQVLVNILQNAFEATPSGGTVTFRIMHNGNNITFTIIDTGSGIPEEIRSKIFDLYFSTKPSGSGIGLAVALQIVDQHGGSIIVESTEGKGSSFIIRIPCTHTK